MTTDKRVVLRLNEKELMKIITRISIKSTGPIIPSKVGTAESFEFKWSKKTTIPMMM